MKRDRPILKTLVWVFVGAIVGAIIFLAHFMLAHPERAKVDKQVERLPWN